MSESTGAQLRSLIGRREGLILPGASNALSARVIEAIGFEAAYVTGAGVTNSLLGLPDLGFLSLSEMASQVVAMAEVVEIPLIVDADTGYGNAVNVWNAVRVLERAGAAGIQIEDQVAPKRCGHFDGQEVIAAPEMVQKIRSATAARRDERTVIVARTDARAAHGLDEALGRASAYAEAGADLLFVEGLRTVEELRAAGAVAAGVPKLVNVVQGGKTPMIPRSELHDMGYAVVLYANAALQGAIHGMQLVLEELRTSGDLTRVEASMTTFSERQRLVQKTKYDALGEEY